MAISPILYAQENNQDKEAQQNSQTIEVQEDTFGVPIPVIGLDPNEGSTLGVILAIVSEKEGRLSSIIGPVATYNELVGYSADLNYFGFPSTDISYKLFFSHTTENFWGYAAEYYHRRFFAESLTFSGEFLFTRTASNRFFGIGQNSEQDDESTYTAKAIRSHLTLTMELWPQIFASLSLRGRYMKTGGGIVEDFPSLEEQFPGIEGGDGGHATPVKITLEYDSRDCIVSPLSGINAEIFLEAADESVLSSFSFQRYGASIKAFFHVDAEARFVTAFRVLLEYLEGNNIPFFELSSLGGGSTLRGFGAGRFYDQHRILFNVEERIRVYRWLIGDISLDIETAVFADIGQVFSSLRDVGKDLEIVAGAGVRFVVRSQIVAKVDIGFGSEGNSVFAGLHYPF